MDADILLIDKDKEFSETLKEQFGIEGYTVHCEYDGESALKRAINFSYALIIMDVILPSINGFQVLKLIREHTDTPVLILSARRDDIDKIVSLELGADDFLAKPCNSAELIARIHAILRRSNKTSNPHPIIKSKDIYIDCARRLAFYKKAPLELTNTEFNILEVLMKSPDQAFSKEELTEYALGRKYTVYDRSIDVHISNLRNKLGDNKNNEVMIKTVRGFGYMFNA